MPALSGFPRPKRPILVTQASFQLKAILLAIQTTPGMLRAPIPGTTRKLVLSASLQKPDPPSVRPVPLGKLAARPAITWTAFLALTPSEDRNAYPVPEVTIVPLKTQSPHRAIRTNTLTLQTILVKIATKTMMATNVMDTPESDARLVSIWTTMSVLLVRKVTCAPTASAQKHVTLASSPVPSPPSASSAPLVTAVSRQRQAASPRLCAPGLTLLVSSSPPSAQLSVETQALATLPRTLSSCANARMASTLLGRPTSTAFPTILASDSKASATMFRIVCLRRSIPSPVARAPTATEITSAPMKFRTLASPVSRAKSTLLGHAKT